MTIHQFGKKLLQKPVFPYLKEYLEWRVGGGKGPAPEFAPFSINLDLTAACNFKCPHCIDGDIINTGKMLDLEYVKKIVGDWSKKGLKSVILIGGGEPVLYPYFEEVVKFLKDLSLQVGIVSNGTNLRKIENICNLLDKKDWVRLSIDAGTNETFQRIHQPRLEITLEEVMAGVKKIRQKNKECQIGYSYLIIGDDKRVNNIILAKNIGEIAKTAQLAKESGFSYLSLKPFINPEGERGTTISDKNLKEIREEIAEAKKLEDDNFKVIESINLLCFYDEEIKKIMQKQPRTCHAQFFRSVVIPSGIYSCSLWRGFASTKIGGVNCKTDEKYYGDLMKNRGEMIEKLNAKENCEKVNCLYAPLNCWIEELINSPKDLEKLEAIADFNDYFL